MAYCVRGLTDGLPNFFYEFLEFELLIERVVVLGRKGSTWSRVRTKQGVKWHRSRLKAGMAEDAGRRLKAVACGGEGKEWKMLIGLHW